MKKIERIIQLLEKQGIDVAEFERLGNISNGYLQNTLKRGADITEKILDKIRKNSKPMYALAMQAINATSLNGESEENIEEEEDYKQALIDQLRRENDRLAKLLDTNLTGLAWGQASILAHLSVSLELDAERDAKGDLKKTEQIKQEQGRRISEKLKAPK